MRPFWALIGKQVHESRWSLVLSAAALFGWGWLLVYVTSLNEAEILRLLESDEGGGRMEMMRNLGVGDPLIGIDHDDVLEPSVRLPVDFDLGDRPGLGRGGRGSRARHDGPDLVPPGSALGLSRVSGLGRDGGSGDPGGWPCWRVPRSPCGTTSCASRRLPGPCCLPRVNLAALGLPIYGYTLLASSLDHVRWRPTSIGSVLTLAGVIAFIVSLVPRPAEDELEALAGAGVDLQGL